MPRKRRMLPMLTAAIFAAMAVVNTFPMLQGETWPGFTRASYTVDAILVSAWLVAAVGSALRKLWGYVAAVAGTAAALGHGAILRLGQPAFGGELAGFFFLACGIALVPLLFAEAHVFKVHFSPDEDANGMNDPRR